MLYKNVTAVVLAAGKGTRMKSDRAKVLHEIFYVPMVHHVLDSLKELDLNRVVVVTGHQSDQVKSSLADYDVTFCYQSEQLGTGHAVLCTEGELAEDDGIVLILCGDTPLVRPGTLQRMIDQHYEDGATLSVMTTQLDNPTNYGRVITDDDGNILCIVEEKDANESARQIKEVNAGIYCVDSKFLFKALKQVGTDNKQNEVYLTDIVATANFDGKTLSRFVCPDSDEVMGVNSRVELAKAHFFIQARRNRQLMSEGVTLLNPAGIDIEKSVRVGGDTVVYPNVHIGGDTVVGKGCVIGRNSIIKNCRLGDRVVVGPLSYLEGVTIGNDEVIPPSQVRCEKG